LPVLLSSLQLEMMNSFHRSGSDKAGSYNLERKKIATSKHVQGDSQVLTTHRLIWRLRTTTGVPYCKEEGCSILRRPCVISSCNTALCFSLFSFKKSNGLGYAVSDFCVHHTY
jgi:hypothetical protein